MPSSPPEGTQKGDVYSFAIICQEIVYRKGPFWLEDDEYIPAEGAYCVMPKNPLHTFPYNFAVDGEVANLERT